MPEEFEVEAGMQIERTFINHVMQISVRTFVLLGILGVLYALIRPQFSCVGCGTCGGGEVDIFFLVTFIVGFLVNIVDSFKKSKLPLPENGPA